MIGSLFGIATGIVLLVMAFQDGDPVFWIIATGWTVIAVAHMVANMKEEDRKRRRSVGSCGAGTCGGGDGGGGGGSCGGGCGGD